MRLLYYFCAYSLTLGGAQSQGTVWFSNKMGTQIDAPFFGLFWKSSG